MLTNFNIYSLKGGAVYPKSVGIDHLPRPLRIGPEYAAAARKATAVGDFNRFCRIFSTQLEWGRNSGRPDVPSLRT
jgi:hypothetical protein